MDRPAKTELAPKTSRRVFIDLLLSASVLGWLASVTYPILRYLKPLPQTGPTGPTRLTHEEISKLEENKFVITMVNGKRTIALEPKDEELLAFSAICTHEGCTVTYLAGKEIIWCPCHDGRYDLHGRVISGPPPRPLPEYAIRRQPGGAIVVSIPEEKA
jgi:cytochrome b6-f complex iron-sulfur subunit